MTNVLGLARERILDERRPLDPTLLGALGQLGRDEIPLLLELADDVRAAYRGNRAHVEALFNAKRGGCSEDCAYCSQSARYATDVAASRTRSAGEIVAAARAAQARGVGEFCVVVAVRGPSAGLVTEVAAAVRAIKAELPLRVAVSLGIMGDDELATLALAGVDKVNHNLETSRRYFPEICTTHTYEERWETCLAVKRAGLALCCGGIVGMGETLDDRIDFLADLQRLDPAEVPINFLNPRPGTPLVGRALLDPWEALSMVALTRLALPNALVRFAGGREITLRALQDLGMRSGADGLIVGDYLTTAGRADAEDFAMLDRLGFARS